MSPEPTPSVKFTYEDFLHFPDDGKRHEIIGGEHYVTPSPNTKHQRVATRLTVALGRYLERDPIGEVFAAPFDVVFSDFDVVEPDLLYISRERAGVLTEQHVRGAPDLVIEILSSGTRKTDEITKRRLYERFDVNEYWIVDPELDAIEVYRRVEGAFARVADLRPRPATGSRHHFCRVFPPRSSTCSPPRSSRRPSPLRLFRGRNVTWPSSATQLLV